MNQSLLMLSSTDIPYCVATITARGKPDGCGMGIWYFSREDLDGRATVHPGVHRRHDDPPRFP